MEKTMTVSKNTKELLDALNKGISLPSSYYTDATIAEREIELIFRRSWQYVGSVFELRNVGDFVTAYVGNIPVVAVRNQAGIQAFVNVCRHRRHEVMKGCGHAAIMQCRYHAWTYDLDGCLKAAPRADREADFNTGDYPLISVRTEALGPFVFVNFDDNDQSVHSYFGEVLNIIAGSGIDINTLEVFERSSWESNSNWKTMLENYLECYHCPVAHPGFSAAIDVDPDSYKLTSYEWFFSQVGKAREEDSKAKARVQTYDTRGEIKESQYHVLWPNFTININPGFPNLSVDVWNPHGPDRAQGFSTQFFAPGVDKKWAEELVQFNSQVGREDDDLTDSVQRGLAAGIPEHGRFLANSESLIIEFQKRVVKALSEERSVSKALSIVFIALVLQMVSHGLPARAANQILYAHSSVANQVLIAQGGALGFSHDDLPKRLSSKPKFKELADQMLADWTAKNYSQAVQTGKSLVQSAKPKREEINQLTTVGDAQLAAGDSNKAAVLQLIAYQAVMAAGKATTDDAITRLHRIVSILISGKTTDADRIFAADLSGQALQTRRLAGGILDSDAPLLLTHARLEFSLKRWESCIREYEFWIGIFESKGKNPPADELPDALGELGIAYTSLKNISKAETYFLRACDACTKLNGTTVTPLNQYDVEDFLIFNLLAQNKIDQAKDRAQIHLKFKESTLGFNNPKLAEELNRYADLFEQVGETSFSFSLRTRASRVTPR
jgi:choline monooxygenase